MQKNEFDALRISRLLTPEHRGNLLAFVHLAYAAETSITRKTRNYSVKKGIQKIYIPKE